MRIFLTVFAALLVAGGSGFYLLHALRAQDEPVAVSAPPPVPVSTRVFVPAANLAAGTIIRPEHLAEIAIDDNVVTAEMIRADADGRTVLEGSVARHALARGVPVARSSVVQPGERGFLAAVLSPGMRAISIPISETAGVSGLVMPGDRVGIILTYVLSSDVIDAGREVRASETVLANLRVLALDQRLQEVPSQAPVQAAAETVTQTIPIARTATLEVTPREAEMLTLATQLGELSMVLNSIRDGDVEEDAPSADLAAIAAAAAGGASAGTELRRALTLDSQVTTLLDRGTTGEARSLSERMSRVQVVRGIDSSAFELEINPTPPGANEGAATPPASLGATARAMAPLPAALD